MENLENEIWIDVKGYEGLYQVSNLGRVKSFKNKREKILKPNNNQKNYLSVNLCNKTKPKKFYIHQLVCICFLDFIPNNLRKVIDHIDNNPLNNKLSNLQIISHRENIVKGFDNKLSKIDLKSKQKISCNIQINGKSYYLGKFKKREEAKSIRTEVLNNFNKNGILPDSCVNFYSDVKGVSYNKLRKNWIAYCYIDKKRIHIGTYKTEFEAIKGKNKFLSNQLNL